MALRRSTDELRNREMATRSPEVKSVANCDDGVGFIFYEMKCKCKEKKAKKKNSIFLVDKIYFF